MSINIFQGLITALITPLNGELIDFDSLEKLIYLQIEANVDGIVIGGSTGEGNSLSDAEYNALVKAACEYIGQKIPIIASISTTSTNSAIKKINEIKSFGLSGLMCTVPHYTRPTQNGVLEHFKLIHDNSDLPIMIYIHPGRTGIDLNDETIIELSNLQRVVAVKDAGGDIERPLRLSTRITSNFNMLTGDDSNSIAYKSHGGRGCVSVISNLLPKQCKQIQDALADGKYNEALEMQKAFMPLYQAVFSEPNPIGIKYATSLLGHCTQEIRLPLMEALPETKKAIKEALEAIADLFFP